MSFLLTFPLSHVIILLAVTTTCNGNFLQIERWRHLATYCDFLDSQARVCRWRRWSHWSAQSGSYPSAPESEMDLPATHYGKVDQKNPVVAVFERDLKTFLTLMRRTTSGSSQDNSSYAKGWDNNGQCGHHSHCKSKTNSNLIGKSRSTNYRTIN